MIQAREVTKSFGRVRVLNGVTLDVAPGQVTAIVGPNASGKTTFNRIVLGLVGRDGGSLLFDGRPLDADGMYRERIGYMPQTVRYPENLRGDDIVRLLSDVRYSGQRRDEELIERFALGDVLRQPLRILSGGMRQRVNAALAFLFTPDLLMLDEPTAGLDPVSSSTLKDKIRSERAAGRTFIVTSHIMSEVEEIADRVAFLLDGIVRFEGTPAALRLATGEPTLERAIARLMRRYPLIGPPTNVASEVA